MYVYVYACKRENWEDLDNTIYSVWYYDTLLLRFNYIEWFSFLNLLFIGV